MYESARACVIIEKRRSARTMWRLPILIWHYLIGRFTSMHQFVSYIFLFIYVFIIKMILKAVTHSEREMGDKGAVAEDLTLFKPDIKYSKMQRKKSLSRECAGERTWSYPIMDSKEFSKHIFADERLEGNVILRLSIRQPRNGRMPDEIELQNSITIVFICPLQHVRVNSKLEN